MLRGRIAIPLAVAATVAVAEVAVLLLRPRDGVIEAAPVSAGSYFSAQQLDRARDFAGPQRWLGTGVMLVELGVLALFVARPPRLRVRRPLVAAAATGAVLAIAVDASGLPLRAVARERAKDVGLVTQSWTGWAGDIAKGWGIAAVLSGAGAGLAVGMMRRMPRTWWAPGAVVLVGFGAVSVYAGPVVLDPLFNRFEKLPAGETRADVLEIARRAGIDVGEVFVVDASRRTTAANAYVTGLGNTKRVVLYDTLLEHFDRDETRLVVAHELAHVKHRDVPNGLLFLLIVAPPGMFAVAVVTRRFGATVPALALALALVATPVGWVSNQLSRRIEARADSTSLRLTGDPEAFLRFEQRIAIRNVADPDPPRWRHLLFGTHPTALERLGIGEAFRTGDRPRPPGGS